jgi:hypothetical protein
MGQTVPEKHLLRGRAITIYGHYILNACMIVSLFVNLRPLRREVHKYILGFNAELKDARLYHIYFWGLRLFQKDKFIRYDYFPKGIRPWS